MISLKNDALWKYLKLIPVNALRICRRYLSDFIYYYYADTLKRKVVEATACSTG